MIPFSGKQIEAMSTAGDLIKKIKMLDKQLVVKRGVKDRAAAKHIAADHAVAKLATQQEQYVKQLESLRQQLFKEEESPKQPIKRAPMIDQLGRTP